MKNILTALIILLVAVLGVSAFELGPTHMQGPMNFGGFNS